MIDIDEARVDKIRNDLILSGTPFSQANSMAVDIYLKEAIMEERMRKKALADLYRMPYNTAARARAKRPTQTTWRNPHANI